MNLDTMIAFYREKLAIFVASDLINPRDKVSIRRTYESSIIVALQSKNPLSHMRMSDKELGVVMRSALGRKAVREINETLSRRFGLEGERKTPK